MKKKIQFELFDKISIDASQDKQTIFIPRPSKDSIKFYLNKWNDEKVELQEELLKSLFTELMPTNTKLSDIYAKTILLNRFYSTVIFDTFSLAKHIHSKKNLDKLIAEGSTSAIDEFKNVPLGKDKKTRTLTSFASKYCGFHNPKSFPLYDSYLFNLLCAFRDATNSDNFTKFTSKDLTDYPSYKNILLEFMSFYKLDKEEYSFKKLDMYLWQLGYDLHKWKKLADK